MTSPKFFDKYYLNVVIKNKNVVEFGTWSL